MRIFQVHVERGRIGGAGPAKSNFAAPEFHAALVVGVENPHVLPLPKKALDGASFLPLAKLHAEWIRARRGRRANVKRGELTLLFFRKFYIYLNAYFKS
jgi:hypothetical protein